MVNKNDFFGVKRLVLGLPQSGSGKKSSLRPELDLFEGIDSATVDESFISRHLR